MRIILDPDDVNQDVVVTITDGTQVTLADADRRMLDQIARQLHVHRSAYAHAYEDPAVGDRVATGELRVEDHAPLYQRVAELAAAARSGHRRPAKSMDLTLLLQGRIWTSSSGTTLELAAMTPTHRRNLRGWLARNSDDLRDRSVDELDDDQRAMVVPADPWVAGTPLVRRLDDLIAAETARERAMDQARQIARSVEYERSGDWPDR